MALKKLVEKLNMPSKVKEPKPVCPHCEFIKKVFMGKELKHRDYFLSQDPLSDREFWFMAEVFIHLHGGSDTCLITKKKRKV